MTAAEAIKLDPTDTYWDGGRQITKDEFERIADERGARLFSSGDVVRVSGIDGPTMKVLDVDGTVCLGIDQGAVLVSSYVFDNSYAKPGWHVRQKPTAEALRAAHELIAEALRHQTPLLNINVADVTYAGVPVGSYEVSVRRVD